MITILTGYALAAGLTLLLIILPLCIAAGTQSKKDGEDK